MYVRESSLKSSGRWSLCSGITVPIPKVVGPFASCAPGPLPLKHECAGALLLVGTIWKLSRVEQGILPSHKVQETSWQAVSCSSSGRGLEDLYIALASLVKGQFWVTCGTCALLLSTQDKVLLGGLAFACE